MAEPKENVLMEKIVSLCKRRGFIFQSSEIYGGINGFWDYGPLGAELKRNVKELWWNTMTRQRDDVAGLEATIIMSPKIWEASGHVSTFSDPMCDCLVTGKRFRADQVDRVSGWVVQFVGAVDMASMQKLSEESKSPETSTVWSNTELAAQLKILTDNSSITFRDKYRGGCIMLCGDQEKQMDALKFAIQHGVFQNSILHPFLAMDVGNDSGALDLADGKALNPAAQTAQEFYKKRGILNPVVIVRGMEKSENSQRFNPENGAELTPARPFNLMFKTFVGPVESEDNVAYLRPETAQAIFAQFKNVLETSRQKIPFGIGQIGKAFRNEVTPRNYTFRSREFEQMELEFFIKPDEAVEAICGNVGRADLPVGQDAQQRVPTENWGWQLWHQYWVEERIKFYENIGLPRTTLEEYWQKPEELAHYARATVDILFKFPFGTQELEGIAARSDFDLSQHERFSGKPMGVFDEELRAAWGKLPKEKQDELWKRYYDNRKNYLTKSAKDLTPEQIQKEATEDANGLAKGQYIPHVIEPSAGVDRLILALICNAYSEVTETDDKGKSETRVILKFHPRVAPIKVGVLPLLKNKPALVEKAQAVRDLLRPWMNVFYDDAGSIGRRYARQDEAGTPFCVTIDFDTLGEKPELLDTVTIRYRDDGKQERLKISELRDFLLSQIR